MYCSKVVIRMTVTPYFKCNPFFENEHFAQETVTPFFLSILCGDCNPPPSLPGLVHTQLWARGVAVASIKLGVWRHTILGGLRGVCQSDEHTWRDRSPESDTEESPSPAALSVPHTTGTTGRPVRLRTCVGVRVTRLVIYK